MGGKFWLGAYGLQPTAHSYTECRKFLGSPIGLKGMREAVYRPVRGEAAALVFASFSPARVICDPASARETNSFAAALQDAFGARPLPT